MAGQSMNAMPQDYSDVLGRGSKALWYGHARWAVPSHDAEDEDDGKTGARGQSQHGIAAAGRREHHHGGSDAWSQAETKSGAEERARQGALTIGGRGFQSRKPGVQHFLYGAVSPSGGPEAGGGMAQAH